MKRFSFKPAAFLILFSAFAVTAAAESTPPVGSTIVCVVTGFTVCLPPPPPPCPGTWNQPNGNANPNANHCNVH
jgi:hypothetical protein